MRIDMGMAHHNSIFSINKNLIVIPNVSYGFFHWGEADLVAVSKAGFLTEGEIKTTLSDLKADAHKQKWGYWNPSWVKDIKKHYYIIPEEILEKAQEFMRPESGVITYSIKVGGEGVSTYKTFKSKVIRYAKDNKEAKKIEGEKLIKLCRLASYRFWYLTEEELNRRDQNKSFNDFIGSATIGECGEEN